MAQSLRLAAQVVAAVTNGESLAAAFARLVDRPANGAALRAAARDLSYRTLREHGINDAVLERLLRKPLVRAELRGLLLVALNELRAAPGQAHTIVDQTVEATRLARLQAAPALTNALLRAFLRDRLELERAAEANEAVLYRHPQWWIDRMRAAYPHRWQAALEQDNRHPPLTLRVNCRKTGVSAYLGRLTAAGIAARSLGASAVRLDKPTPVAMIPGFAEGEVSVQDAGAQLAAPLLDLRDGLRVLDACAAPGGKAGHVLELADCRLLALDTDTKRITRIGENLARLGLAAEIRTADSLTPQGWWDGALFDRILADVPCTASGVARRHPDIKWLRRESDIASFADTQSKMLDALWRLLIPGGKLLYVTCSVFPQENVQQVTAFLGRHADARRLSLAAPYQAAFPDGQLLPDEEHDGFFYALLEKLN
jgi:16S rRNA (cytosine967-C5)-methyltransferase